jgi:hypothetical protein
MKPSVILGGLLSVLALAAPAPAPAQEADIYDDTVGATQRVPPPPVAIPEPGLQQPQQEIQPPAVPSGQWVNTWQYGWVWMPYGAPYTAVYGSQPVMYVYGPVFGWTWVAAPWVWGWGPWPYFGVAGYAHFCWYGHGPWHDPGWHARPWPATGPRQPPPAPRAAGSTANGTRVAPPMRGGAVAPPMRRGSFAAPAQGAGFIAPMRGSSFAAPMRGGGFAAPMRGGGAGGAMRGGGGAHFGGRR